MKGKILFRCILSVTCSFILVQGQTSEADLKERVVSWKGEKVLFRSHFCDATPQLTEQIRGKTGVISGAVLTDRKPKITIMLDGTGETIIAESAYCLGFFSEKESLQKLVDRPLWTKGYLPDSAGNLPPLTKVRVSRLDWSWGILKDMNLVLTTEQGREVGLPFRVPVRPCVIGRFCAGNDDKPWDLGTEFFEQDPRTLHRAWSEDMFTAIASGIVAQGMT